MNRCAITAPRVTRTGTYGTGRAPQRGCIRLHLILYSIHITATERRCARSHSNTPQVKKLAPLTTRSSSLKCVSAAEHHTAEQYSKTGKTKPLKHLHFLFLSLIHAVYMNVLLSGSMFYRVKFLLICSFRTYISCYAVYKLNLMNKFLLGMKLPVDTGIELAV